jgi:hypothetical protein
MRSGSIPLCIAFAYLHKARPIPVLMAWGSLNKIAMRFYITPPPLRRGLGFRPKAEVV